MWLRDFYLLEVARMDARDFADSLNAVCNSMHDMLIEVRRHVDAAGDTWSSQVAAAARHAA